MVLLNVELYCSIQKGVSLLLPILINVNSVNKIVETDQYYTKNKKHQKLNEQLSKELAT